MSEENEDNIDWDDPALREELEKGFDDMVEEALEEVKKEKELERDEALDLFKGGRDQLSPKYGGSKTKE